VMMKSFHLDRSTALEWLRALEALYGEASRQIGDLRRTYPNAEFLDLSQFLDPPEKYFWDLGHVYDEANMVIAERIYPEIRPMVERGLRETAR